MVFRVLPCALILLLGFSPWTVASAEEGDVLKFYQEVSTALGYQPRPSFAVDAEARVVFTVADDGSIASAEIAQSSGSPPLDVAALEIVLNASPFPAPPQGARRSLSITIKATRPALGFGNLDRLRE